MNLRSGSIVPVALALACSSTTAIEPGSTSSGADGTTATTSATLDSTTGADATAPGTTMTTVTTVADSEGSADSGDPPIIFDVAGVTDMAVGDEVTCSSDLKRVISDTGVVLETCPPDQGCLAGMCVAACAAAAGAKGSTGCEFTVPTSPFYGNGGVVSQAGPCHALLVSNPWDRPASLTLTRGGDAYDVEDVTRIPSGIGAGASYDDLPNSGLPSGQVAVVFLAHRPGVNNGSSLECPIPPAVLEDTAPNGTDDGTAFELVSDTPIQVYDIIPFGGAASYLPSASLLFPSTAWGDSYLVVSPHADTGSEWMLAVARENGTTISINPNVAITAGSIANPPANMVTDYDLDAGEIA
jgi:IgGFc binding protein